MKKPIYQKIIEKLGLILIGILALGTFFDAISNAISIINFKIALFSTAIIGVSYVTTLYYLKQRKITWIAQKGEKLTLKSINQKLKLPLFGAVILLWIPVIIDSIPTMENKFKGHVLFSKKDNSFKILILPFKIMCKNVPNKDIGDEIEDRLIDINRNDSLNIHPKYFEDFQINKSFNSDSANYLLNFHNADLIIYGSYYDEKCVSNNGDNICYNWISNDNYLRDTVQQNIEVSTNYRITSLEKLRKGDLQGDTDYIIYWIAGLTSYNQGKFSQAIKKWSSIVNNIDSNDLKVRSHLAFSYRDDGQLKKALDLHLESLEIAKEKKDTTQIGILLNDIAQTYSYLANFEQAIHYGKEALNFLQSTFIQDSSLLANTFNNLVEPNRNIGNYDKALELAKKAKELIEVESVTDTLLQLRIYENLGSIYIDLGKYRSALYYDSLSVIICEQYMPENYLYLSNSYNNIALSYENLGLYKEALTYSNKAEKIEQKYLTSRKLLIAMSLANRANLFYYLGDYQKSLDYSMKSFAIREKILPDNHFELGTTCYIISRAYNSLGRYEKALSYARKDLKITKSNLPEGHIYLASSYNNLSNIYLNLDSCGLALKYANIDLKISLSSLDSMNASVGSSFCLLSKGYYCTGEYIKAKELLDKGLKILNKNYSDDNPRVKIHMKYKKDLENKLIEETTPFN